MESLYIIVPAYNEAKNVEKVISDWYPIIEIFGGGADSRLVIIDDGSTDDTYKLVCKYAENYPFIVPLTKKNGGHGSAVLYGYRYAIENGADYIFQTDSDGQTEPKEFELFWLHRKEYDAILGNRVLRKDGIFRKAVEKILCMMLFMIFGIKVPDANAPFRLMKREVLEKYIQNFDQDFSLPNVMLTTYFKYNNEKLLFCEITFKPRYAGSNSMNIRKIIIIGWKAWKDFRILKKRDFKNSRVEVKSL